MGRVKLTMTKKFRCKYFQTQSTFTIINIITKWTMFKVIFDLKEMKKVHVIGKIMAEPKVQLQEIKKKSRTQWLSSPIVRRIGSSHVIC